MNGVNEDLYALQWNNHTKLIKGIFNTFRNDNELVDVTLSCEGKQLKAHKIVLSACSIYFLELFRDNPCKHPIIILRDIKFQAMMDILNFMYVGEVNVAMENLNMFLKTAEYLQVKGLTEELPSLGNNDDIKNNIQNKEKENLITTTKENKIDQVETSRSKIKLKSRQRSFDNTDITEQNINKQHSTNKLPANNEVKEVCTSQKIENSSKFDYKENVDAMEHENFDRTDDFKTEMLDIDDYNEDDSIEFIEIEQHELPNNALHEQFLLDNYEGTSSASTTTNNKSYPCPRCNKVFNHQISLKLHLPRHSGRTSCHLCHAVLGRKYDLKVHLKRKHNIEMSICRKRSSENPTSELWLTQKNMPQS